ncbi:exonuclease domain-containing protein [Actinokineospora auranticolor]|uniref:DNA polymerase-3 subunit epsilon n=1 Tax=Actinokineospora auranticolor TaxID=155976 RepID=A0A2S6GZ68_9PSEU|nr:exonuclease domain-containing protein [Actinokineospora auranticolor]PPK70457.1 DNA polymerase-3 subunit epsilon [Actinokineospora auranticolor]
MGAGYAVVDVETTGLSPGYKHRVVEIAVVQLDDSGEVTGEWCTVVNPQRDLGPQHIHGVRAADARRAPVFADIAGAVVRLLGGRVLVGHNVSFDARFLQAEYERLGVDVQFTDLPTLCTMRLASRFLDTPSRSLSACCEAAGIPLVSAHSAAHDARATAALLTHCLRRAGAPAPWRNLTRVAAGWPWPDLPPVAFEPVVRGADGPDDPHFLGRLVDRLPRVGQPASADDYLAVLDRALRDRYLSADEQQELLDTANGLGLSRAEVLTLHRGYLADLSRVAWADQVLTDEEATDLRTVGALLGLGADDIGQALSPRFRLAVGDGVVFTGQTREPREIWERRAAAAGLVVGPGVSKKKTRLLVAADLDTMSGKAAKARGFGIPVVSEDSFAGMLAALSAGD